MSARKLKRWGVLLACGGIPLAIASCDFPHLHFPVSVTRCSTSETTACAVVNAAADLPHARLAGVLQNNNDNPACVRMRASPWGALDESVAFGADGAEVSPMGGGDDEGGSDPTGGAGGPRYAVEVNIGPSSLTIVAPSGARTTLPMPRSFFFSAENGTSALGSPQDIAPRARLDSHVVFRCPGRGTPDSPLLTDAEDSKLRKLLAPRRRGRTKNSSNRKNNSNGVLGGPRVGFAIAARSCGSIVPDLLRAGVVPVVPGNSQRQEQDHDESGGGRALLGDGLYLPPVHIDDSWNDAVVAIAPLRHESERAWIERSIKFAKALPMRHIEHLRANGAVVFDRSFSSASTFAASLLSAIRLAMSPYDASPFWSESDRSMEASLAAVLSAKDEQQREKLMGFLQPRFGVAADADEQRKLNVEFDDVHSGEGDNTRNGNNDNDDDDDEDDGDDDDDDDDESGASVVPMRDSRKALPVLKDQGNPGTFSCPRYHRRLYRFDGHFLRNFIHPNMTRALRVIRRKLAKGHETYKDYGIPGSLTEIVDHVFRFSLFTEEYARLLVEEAEHCGRWSVMAPSQERANAAEYDPSDPEYTRKMTMFWNRFPGLSDVWGSVVKEVLYPLIRYLWPHIELEQAYRPYFLRYLATDPDRRSMGVHCDQETVALIVYLSHGTHTGGGTHFVRYNTTVHEEHAGQAVIYPGGFTHLHAGMPITNGSRYLLLASF